jgi:hypothetical protein
MTLATFRAFVKHASTDPNTPYDYHVTRAAISKMFPKLASGALGHAVELGGLGILARPSIQKIRGKPMTESSTAKHELLGLGTLAAPSAYHLLTRR